MHPKIIGIAFYSKMCSGFVPKFQANVPQVLFQIDAVVVVCHFEQIRWDNYIDNYQMNWFTEPAIHITFTWKLWRQLQSDLSKFKCKQYKINNVRIYR